MDKRNLVILSSSVATALGGTETYVMGEARYLSKDFSIKLVCGRGALTEDFRGLIAAESLPYHGFPMIPRSSALASALMRSRLRGKINAFDLESLTLMCSVWGLKAALSGADLIEANYPLESIAFFFAREETKKIIHLHGPWLPPLYKCLRRQVERKVDMVITCSDWSRKTLETLYGMRGVEVVYNSVDTEAFSPKPETRRFGPTAHYDDTLLKVGTVGRLGKSKGTDVLYEAACDMEGVANFFAVGPLGADFSATAAAYKAPNFHFLGPLPNNELNDFYNFVDCFVLPSRVEPFGITVLEAMSCGKAVIASHVGGIPEIIDDGVDGILVPREDSGALKKALEGLAASAARRGDLGCAARDKVVCKFSPEKTYELLKSLYKAVLEGGYRRRL